MVFAGVPQYAVKLDPRMGGALDTPQECGLPKGPHGRACSRRSWKVRAWKSSGRNEGICRERRRERWEGEESCTKGLAGWQENVHQAETRPADRTSLCRKLDGLALNAPAEPVEKLFFLAFNQHRIASDPERSDDGLVRVQFTGKPARPFRHSWNSVDVSQGGPNESAV